MPEGVAPFCVSGVRAVQTVELGWIRWDSEALCKGASASTDDRLGLIEGFASTEHLDLDNEVVEQGGLDWSACRHLTLEHPKTHLNVIGEVLSTAPRSTDDGLPGTYLKGGLYRKLAAGQKVYDHALGIAKSGGTSPFGFSVEGPPDGLVRKGNHIVKARVTSVAVTMGPRNQRAMWSPMMKGLLGGLDIAAELIDRYGLSVTDIQIAALVKAHPNHSLTRGEWLAALRGKA